MNTKELEAEINREMHTLLASGKEPDALRGWGTLRLIIRLSRIACGGVIGFIAWTVINLAPDISSTPLASLTLGNLVKGAGLYFVGLGLFGGAFAAAFGAGPPKKDRTAFLRSEAESIVSLRFQSSLASPRP